MERVVTSVRELPGLSRFLLPLLFSDLQRAASGGPVIIVNASQYGCDALIVFLDRDPVHTPLQITQENVEDLSKVLHALSAGATRADVTKELAFFLRKLWDQTVSPSSIVSSRPIRLNRISGGAPLPSALSCPCTLLVRIGRPTESP